MTETHTAAPTDSAILALPEFLQTGAQRWPDSTWCTAPDGSCTRASMYADALACSAALRDFGVGVGDRVVIVLPNSLAFLRVWFGAALAGAIAVPMNPLAAATELSGVVARTKPAVIIANTETETPAAVVKLSVADLMTRAAQHPAVACDPATHACYIQSSGSTGQPKFIIQTHGMYTMAGEGFPYWLGLTPDDTLLTALPLAHLNAQAYSTLGSWISGRIGSATTLLGQHVLGGGTGLRGHGRQHDRRHA